MKHKTRNLIIIVALLAVTSYFAATSYAKYTKGVNATADVTAAAWVVDIQDKDGTTITERQAMEVTTVNNPHVVNGKIAPGSSGYVEIWIDPEGTEVSFDWDIAVAAPENGPAGFTVTGYEIKPAGEYTGTAATLTDEQKTKTLVGNAAFGDTDIIKVRAYVTWTDTDGDPDADDANHTEAAGDPITLNVTVTVNQHIGA